MSLSVQHFDAYMAHRGHPGLRERSQFSLQDAVWSGKVTAKLRNKFDQLLTRLLLRYLKTDCQAYFHQRRYIVKHINTRLNFAALIGCSIYADEDECRQNETLDDAIEQGLEAGSGPDEAGAEDCSLAYYGFYLKSKLCERCATLGIDPIYYPASMKDFCDTYRREKAAFEADLTHGFGAPETSSPRSS